MDFRSRVYPIPPHITHLSKFYLFRTTLLFLIHLPHPPPPPPLPIAASDMGRAVLQFGVGHPLGKRGLMWLKVHLANLHGAKSK